MFSRVSATIRGGLELTRFVFLDSLPKWHTNRICEGHEDLPSCNAVLEAIKVAVNPKTTNFYNGIARAIFFL